MSRFNSGITLACILLALLILSACSKNSTTTVIEEPTPAIVDLCLSPSTTCNSGLNVSLEVGQTQGLVATAKTAQGTVVTDTFSYLSSNPAVLTIATNGAACAGTWNSLTVPEVCTPGPTGVAQVTATSHNISSPPVTIYVHQRITSVTISKVPNQPATLSNVCFSEGAPSGPESALYEAFALNGTADITASVGPFTWQTVLLAGQTTSAVALTNLPPGSPLNQVIGIANTPGVTAFFSSVGGFHSQPMQFETCPVQSITVGALGNPATSFVVNTGTTTMLNATVTDSLGMNLTAVPLTWNSTDPISASVSGATSTVYGSVGTVSAAALGASAVTVSCTPPGCNGGFSPSLPIYPNAAISFMVKSTSSPASSTAFVTSTGCGASVSTCIPNIVPVTRASASVPFSADAPISIPSPANSFVFDDRGTAGYLGVDSSVFGTQGLITFTGAASNIPNLAGKVLAVSPDGTLSVISDTLDTPNEVFVCTNCNSTTHTTAVFPINGATAAAFSPDSLRAYIVAGSNLYVYSKTDPLRQPTPTLTAPANDVAFLPEGGFAYVAGGASSAVTVWRNCDSRLVDTVPTAATPLMIRALPDAATIAVLDPPFMELINVSPNGTLAGCTPLVTNTISGTFNLGAGNFTPTQFIVSSDGSAAYILGVQPPNSLPFSSIVKFNFATQSPSSISLTGNAVPLSASLSPAGDLLFVGADDGDVHVIDTASQTDLQQITFPFPANSLCYGLGTPPTQFPVPCLPDLVAVKP